MLMHPEDLPQQASGPVPHHRAANFPGGDHSETRDRIRFERLPIGEDAAAGAALALLAKAGEIAASL